MNGPRKEEGKKIETLVCRNPKATQRYEIEDHLECGLVLSGSEVKSLRKNGGDLEGSYARLSNGELFLVGMYIAPYDPAAVFGHEPRRQRKLLASKHEIEKWSGKITMRGFAMVPTRVYFKGSWAKAEIGIGRGRKVGDDREKLRAKAERSEAREAVNRRRR